MWRRSVACYVGHKSRPIEYQAAHTPFICHARTNTTARSVAFIFAHNIRGGRRRFAAIP
jgi:hypothetical protein